MTGFLLGAALSIGGLLTVGLHRVWAGPTVFDRLVAVALVTANTMVILVLVASILDRVDTVVDIAIGYALLAFTLPIALGKHFESRAAGHGQQARGADVPGDPGSPDRTAGEDTTP
jgi:multicomponent Na+:H+ antiporter subunit F